METITRGSAARAKREIVEKDLATEVESFKEGVRRDSEAYFTSANLLDDGVIDPRDTRDVLGMCLEVVTIDPVVGNAGFRGLARM